LAVALEGTPLGGLQAIAYRGGGFALLVPPGHSMIDEAARGPVTMRSADRHDIVGLPEGSALQQTWEARAARRGHRLNYRVRVSSFEAQARLVARGVGLALMPRAVAERLALAWQVHAVPMADPFLDERALLCARDWSALSPAATALVQTLLGRAAA
jgi:DNA-binding transcriptional LysR family regulator